METPEKNGLRMVDPRQVWPPHEVRNYKKLGDIACSMKVNGWQGLPLLGIYTGRGGIEAVTGSHRVAAARAVKLEAIPVYVICEPAPWVYDLLEACDDFERLDAIKACCDDPEVLRIMQAEIDKHRR